MFSVCIIVSSWHFFLNPFKLQPVWELQLATTLDDYFKNDDIEVSICDLRELRRDGCKYSLDKVADYIPKHDLYVHWMVRTGNYKEIQDVTAQLRKAYPKSKHVLGGAIVNTFKEECNKNFDVIISGAPEESLKDIIKDCLNNDLKKEYYCDWDKSHISKYPFPRRHYISKEAVIDNDSFSAYKNIVGTSCIFSRGCPFKCIFCICKYPNIQCQVRHPESIEAEIEYLKSEYGVNGINLRDELCIPVQQDLARKQIEAIARQKVVWRGQGRVGIGDDILKLASNSGLIELSIGVESVSQQVLDIAKKGTNIEQIKKFIKNCKYCNIKTKLGIILGLPGEPKNIVELTKQFLEEVNPDYAIISGMCIFPSSEIFDNAEYYGIEHIDKNWDKYGHLLYRYGEIEEIGIPFRYAKQNKWGDTFTREEIMNNVQNLQHYLKERNMVW